MLAGDFQCRLRRLNPKLRIWCGDDDSKPASIFFVRGGEFEQVCGIDKNWVPEHTEYRPDGTILRGGWRRAVRILIQRRLVDRWHAQRVFGTSFPSSPRVPRKPVYAPKKDFHAAVGAEKISPDEMQWMKRRGSR